MNNDLLHKAGRAYLENGISLVPIVKGGKNPDCSLLPMELNDKGEFAPSWKSVQRQAPTAIDLARWIDSGIQALGVVCGHVSGGLEILDFDVVRGSTLYPQWCEATNGLSDKLGLPVQRTGGGGYQVGWRCEEIAGNTKLSFLLDPSEASGYKTAIETRGEGGQALITPSLHPSGRSYELISGRFSKTPVITAAHRALFLDSARKLGVQVEPKVRAALSRSAGCSATVATSGAAVADAYNAAHDITECLMRYGYTEHGGRWSRPGKADSLSVHLLDGGKAFSHSSNDLMYCGRSGIAVGQPFSAFDMFAGYEHDFDYKAATRAAALELGMEYRIHTFAIVEGYDNAQIVRQAMFPEGWAVKTLVRKPDVAAATRRTYEHLIAWTNTVERAREVARMLPGVHGVVAKGGMDAAFMQKNGLLTQYLNAVLDEAKKRSVHTEVGEWIL